MSADSAESTVRIGGGPWLHEPLKLAPVDPAHYIERAELREGGMGRIVTAIDRRLGRRVAIKELRSQSPALRKRFETEALITSRLEHPSIVSVHEAGVWPSGEPFYAMKLVAGHPLDEVVDAATSFDARLALVPHVLAVADALAYAHRLRVIHRDLKPQNVLVGDFGETVVIDWGLVKDLGAASTDDDDLAAPPASGGNATTAGEVMGTPGYMPPEQAEGSAVDERADVYAIGALLYFVLAAERPYHRERSSIAVFEAMRHGPPEPLHQLAPGVPPDLHAIVERAMARDPADRYPTARELAEDLHRFQAGQLVAAHRYSVRQRLARWLRRYRIAVIVGAVAATVLATAGTAALVRIVRAQDDAEAARGTAEAHRADAEDLMQFMLGDLQQRLEPIGKLELLDAVATKVTDYYERHPTASGPDDLHQRVLARHNLGSLLDQKGDHDSALREYRAAHELALRLQAIDPGRGLLDRSRSQFLMGEAMRRGGDLAGALAEFRRAVDLGTQLVALEPTPDHERVLAGAYTGAGRSLELLDDLAGALAEHRRARAIFERLAAADPKNRKYRRDLTISNDRIGSVLFTQGDLVGALAENRAGYRLTEQLAAEDPDDTVLQRDLVIGGFRIGEIAAQTDTGAALVEFRRSRDIAARLASRDPSNTAWQDDLVTAHQSIGRRLIASGQHDDALPDLEAARRILEQLVARQPSNRVWREHLARNLALRAQVQLHRGAHDAALADLRSVLKVEEDLLAETPGDPARQIAPSLTHSLISSALQQKGDPAGAVAALRQAIAIAERVVTQQPRNVPWQDYFLEYTAALGALLLEARDPAGALAAYRRANATAAQVVAMAPSPERRRTLGNTDELVGNALLATGDAAGALAEYRKGLAIAQEQAAQGPLPGESRPDIAEFRVDVGNAMAALGDRAGAAAEYRTARALFEQLAAEDPGLEKERVQGGLATLRAKLGR